jgi:nicotinamidase/pyrazinamidase
VRLRTGSIRRLLVGGLAEDVCVCATVMDGRNEGFEVTLIADATRPVTPRGGEESRMRMQSAGVQLVRTR